MSKVDISSEAVERVWEEFEISTRPIGTEADMDIYDVNGLTDAGYELKAIVDAQAERIKELEAENGILRTEKHADAEAIASARNDALREAAEVCDTENERCLALASIRVPAMSSEIKRAILALITEDSQ
ncbi:MAG: hypothetical protein CL484_03115 [Acidobacteria bacterium]|nr:hypothetical protein [Acidobacteriota bacterium]